MWKLERPTICASVRTPPLPENCGKGRSRFSAEVVFPLRPVPGSRPRNGLATTAVNRLIAF